MTFADQILAARGGPTDLGGCISSLARGIEQAERYVIGDDVTVACYQLMHSKPSSLYSAMPMCRLPHNTMWLEWNGGLSVAGGFTADATERRPEPLRMGCLVEGIDSQHGHISWAWLHERSGVNVSGLSVMFDWREDGDVEAWARRSNVDRNYKEFFERWVTHHRSTDAQVAAMMRARPDVWGKLANDPKQVEATRGLLRHEAAWFNKHMDGVIKLIIERATPQEFAELIQQWEGDIRGEAPFVSCFTIMLNSRNAVEHSAVDLTKLNKARQRRGNKPPLLSHTVTRLNLSKARARAAAAAGVSRETARQHLVGGHFKIRTSSKGTNVFWWSPHVRGDASRPMNRRQYEVVE